MTGRRLQFAMKIEMARDGGALGTVRGEGAAFPIGHESYVAE